MSWPLPDEINEAIQTPSVSFADPDLKDGQPVLGASGFPLPRSGNFADVYQMVGADGREWAVKCFTRPATGLDKRYDKVAAGLDEAALPFAVEFTFLKDGLRVKNQWYPVVKMRWVEGLQLNQFVRENAARPAVLDGLLALWTRLAQRLRDAGIAHADLQHGNVMLVSGAKPGSLGLKLLDYDGLYVPALANQPSGERGHSAFQHPERAAQNIYSPDLDRFPHLVVATALKGLAVLGKPLWERYDTGDNLLFTEADFANPAASKLLRELWQSNHPEARALAGRLAIACRKPITQTPWLDQIAPDGHPTPLTTDEEREAAAPLGLATAARPVVATAAWGPAKATPAPVASRPRPVRASDDEPERRPARPASSRLPLLLALGVGVGLLALGGVAAAVYAFAFSSTESVSQATTTQPTFAPPHLRPQPTPPTVPTPKSTPNPLVSNPPSAPTGDPAWTYQKEVVSGFFDPYPINAKTIPISWSVTIPTERVTSWCTGVFTADSKRVALARLNGREIAILDSATGVTQREIKTPTGAMGLLALSDGLIAAQLEGQTNTNIYDPVTGQLVRTVPTTNWDFLPGDVTTLGGDRYVGSASGQYIGGWRPSGPPKTMIAGIPQEPGTLTIYGGETGQFVMRSELGRGRFIFDPTGQRLVLAEAHGRIRWFDIGKKQVVVDVTFSNVTDGWIRAIAPDATRVLYDGTMPNGAGRGTHVIDTATGRLLLTLDGQYTSNARNAAMTQGGSLIALAGPIRRVPTSQVDLVDGQSGKLLGVAQLNDRPDDIMGLTFSPDGRQILVARANKGRFQVIDVPQDASRVAAAPVAPPTPNPNPPPTPTPPNPIQPKPPTRGSKRAVPAEPAVAQAEADLREVYKAEFAKKTAVEKKALAQQLLDLAAKTPDDPTARYAMLRLSRDLAAEAQDGPLVIRAINELGRFYDVPAADQMAAALEKILAVTQQQAALRELADLALTTADKVIAQDGLDAGVRLTQVAATAARRGVLPGADEFDARLATVKKLRDVFTSEVQGALATLAMNPSDPAANQIVGKFRCYHQGRWETGVRHLSRSDSLILKTAADAELDPDAARNGKAGDAWWEVARIATDPVEKKQADARAKMWYLRSLSSLTGLPLARAQTRLSVTVGNITYAPGLIAEFSSSADVFKGTKGRIDTALTFDGKEFANPEGGILPRMTVRWSGVVIPPKPGKYRVVVALRNVEWDQIQIAVGKTPALTTVKKAGTGGGKAETLVTLTDKPTPLVVTFNSLAGQGHGVRVTWVPITSLGDGEETAFSECLFHDKKAETVLK